MLPLRGGSREEGPLIQDVGRAGDPVFVCGMGRSGTTWLCRTLGQSPGLVYVGEAWLIARLEELADWQRKVSEEWGDFTLWRRASVDRTRFIGKLARFYEDVLSDAAGGRRFIEKTTSWNALHLRFLSELFPRGHFVLIHRDGRNQVASLEAKSRRAGKDFDFEHACRRWARAMDVFDAVVAEGAVARSHVVRYETLLDAFDEEFASLCRFVDVEPFRPEPPPANTAFPEVSAPGDFNRRWSGWSAERKEAFERLAGRQLKRWGYWGAASGW